MQDKALIVIDLQNDYFPGFAFPLWQAEECETRIAAAIARARAAGIKVIHVQHLAAGPVAPFFVKGTEGAAIRPAILAAAPDAPVVVKQFADSFHETDLAQHLEGIRHLMICGMMTQNCVTHTAISPQASGYKVDVLADLCTTVNEPIHMIALHGLTSRLQPVTSDSLF